MIGGGITGLITLLNTGDGQLKNFAIAFGISLVWISIFLLKMPFNLKSISADENGIRIKSTKDFSIIKYNHVRSISKFDFTNPWMITLKYFDEIKGKEIKISYMPNSKYQKFLQDDEMTSFIMEKSKLNNPNFVESSTIKNLLLLFLAGTPFFIGMIYFMLKSGFGNIVNQ